MIGCLIGNATQYATHTTPHTERRKSYRVSCEAVSPNKPDCAEQSQSGDGRQTP